MDISSVATCGCADCTVFGDGRKGSTSWSGRRVRPSQSTEMEAMEGCLVTGLQSFFFTGRFLSKVTHKFGGRWVLAWCGGERRAYMVERCCKFNGDRKR